jgi:hypothetical protein
MTRKLTRKMEVKPMAIQGYTGLLSSVSQLLEQARQVAARSVNEIITVTYLEIGRRMVEYEQKGSDRAAYGETLLKRLSKDLIARFGRGYSEENLRLMPLFYMYYRERISQTLSGKSSVPPPTKKRQTVSGFFPVSATSISGNFPSPGHITSGL